MKRIILVLTLIVLSISTNAQNITMAKAFYKKAQREYEKENYKEAVNLLQKTVENLNGETNPDIVYLEAKSRIKNDINIKKAKELFENFINTANKNDERIDEVSAILVDIETSNEYDEKGFRKTNILETLNKNEEQSYIPIPSPKSKVFYTIDNNIITIEYSRFSVKNRKMIGDIIPFNTLWRTGANQNTTFETSEDLIIGGKKLPKGKYSIYSIPESNNWEIIFYKDFDNWGLPRKFNPNKIALRLFGFSTKNEFKETFLISITDNNDEFKLNFELEDVKVSLPFKFKSPKLIEEHFYIDLYQKIGLTNFIFSTKNLSEKENQQYNYNPSLTVNEKIMLGGMDINSGKYDFVLIKENDILKELKLIGKDGNSYKIEHFKQLEHSEKIQTIYFEYLRNNSAIIHYKTQDFGLEIPVKVFSNESVVNYSNQNLSSINESELSGIAAYLLSENIHLVRAKELIDYITDKNDNSKFWQLTTKAEIYHANNLYKDALKIAKKAKKMAKDAGNDLYVKKLDKLLNEWKNK